jgi:hypothetical protein
MKWCIVAIAAMGVVRFILDAGGVSKDVVKFFSMSVLVLAGWEHRGFKRGTASMAAPFRGFRDVA